MTSCHNSYRWDVDRPSVCLSVTLCSYQKNDQITITVTSPTDRQMTSFFVRSDSSRTRVLNESMGKGK